MLSPDFTLLKRKTISIRNKIDYIFSILSFGLILFLVLACSCMWSCLGKIECTWRLRMERWWNVQLYRSPWLDL